MRQRGFPTSEDVHGPPTGEVAAFGIRVAVYAAQWLTKTQILPERVAKKHLFLKDKYVLLDDYPVMQIRIDGQRPSGQFDMDPRLGLMVNYDAPQKEYEISYIRGFVEGTLPQIYGELIRQLASVYLGSNEYQVDDIGAIAEACVGIREQADRERKAL